MNTVTKLWRLLTPPERRHGMTLAALTFIGAVLETFSLGMVIPAIAVLLRDDLSATYAWAPALVAVLGHPAPEDIVIRVMIALVLLYLLKLTYLGFVGWFEGRFVFGLQERISRDLFRTYLRQPYVFHLGRNSAELMHNAMAEVGTFCHNCLLPGILILTESLVLAGVCCLLLVIEPLGAMVIILLLGGSAWLFQHAVHQRLVALGQVRQQHDARRTQYLQEGLGGAKDVQLLGREDYFLQRYDRHNHESARAWESQQTLYHLPRLWLELLGVSALALLVVTMALRGRDPVAIVRTLALFSAAAFRLIPSAHRALSVAQSFLFGLPAIDRISAELRLYRQPPARRTNRIETFSTIEVREVTFSYPGAPGPSLRNVSLLVRKGDAIGLVGPSGSGKSTLADVVLGLLAPECGRVLVDGVDIQEDLRGWQDRVGYVPQSVYLTDDTVRRNIAFGLPDPEIDERAVQRAIAAAQLQDFVETLPHGLDTVVGERGVRLSGGQRQRIGIARALYHDPDVLVLDEATSALDTQTENGVMQAVTALRGTKTLFVVAHRLSTVAHCDVVYRLEQGRLVSEAACAPSS